MANYFGKTLPRKGLVQIVSKVRHSWTEGKKERTMTEIIYVSGLRLENSMQIQNNKYCNDENRYEKKDI